MVEAIGPREDRWQHCRKTAIARGSGPLMNIALFGSLCEGGQGGLSFHFVEAN